MAYNSGLFSLFNQPASASAIVADAIRPTFSFTGSISSLFGVSISPSLNMQSTGSITNFYGQRVAPSLNFTSGFISTVFGVNISGPSVSSGTISNAYSLYVSPFSGAASIANNFTAYFEGSVGIGTTTPQSYLDVAGSMAVGTYAGAITASVSQLIISGSLGIAKTVPAYAVDVTGVVSATQIFSPQTTRRYQNSYISQGLGCSLSGGNSGTKIALNSTTCQVFDLVDNGFSTANMVRSGSYDGRYVYMVPANGTLLVRYDSFLPFSASTSYQAFDLALLNASITGFSATGFDGRYIYMSSAVIARYDITLPFAASTSYSVFNLALINSNPLGFGMQFDGTYLYMCSPYGNFVRYNTTLPLSSVSSYQTFIPPAVLGIVGISGYQGGTFDGRYLYLTPQSAVGATAAYLVSYDTFAPFAASSSYSLFNLVSILGGPIVFQGAIFTGRYIYCVLFAGLPYIVRYDTTSPFGQSASYAQFNLSAAGFGTAFIGGTFDGRYVYFTPVFSSQMVRYDTLQPFTSSASYVGLTLTTVNSLCTSFQGVSFDGRYAYFMTDSNGLVISISTYASAQATYLNALAAPQGLTLLNGGGLVLASASTSGSATGGSANAVPTQTAGYIVTTINGTQRKIVFYNN